MKKKFLYATALLFACSLACASESPTEGKPIRALEPTLEERSIRSALHPQELRGERECLPGYRPKKNAGFVGYNRFAEAVKKRMEASVMSLEAAIQHTADATPKQASLLRRWVRNAIETLPMRGQN